MCLCNGYIQYISSGTKHIDPDTGLIYFKYDFGYEFGILFPGQGKRVLADGSSSSTSQQNAMGTRKGDIEVPVIHEKSNGIHQGFNTLPLCKKSQHKNVKWETESEWSDAEEMKHHGWRYEQPTPSPKSLSPSIPSQSPRYFYQPDTSGSTKLVLDFCRCVAWLLHFIQDALEKRDI